MEAPLTICFTIETGQTLLLKQQENQQILCKDYWELLKKLLYTNNLTS